MSHEDFRVVREVAAKQAKSAAWARGVGLALVALMVAITLTVSTTLIYLVVQARREQRARADADQFGVQVVKCVLDELGELRAAAEAHYQEMAEVHTQRPTRDTKPSVEDRAPPEAAERLERACSEVIEGLQNGEGQ